MSFRRRGSRQIETTSAGVPGGIGSARSIFGKPARFDTDYRD